MMKMSGVNQISDRPELAIEPGPGLANLTYALRILENSRYGMLDTCAQDLIIDDACHCMRLYLEELKAGK